MNNGNGFKIIDNALSLAVTHLIEQGLPEDEAHIAMLLRLKHLVPSEIQQVADLLSDDEELNAHINQNSDPVSNISSGV